MWEPGFPDQIGLLRRDAKGIRKQPNQ